MVQRFQRIDCCKCKHRSDLNIDRISAANLNKDFGMISFCPPAFNPSRPLSKIKTLRENRKRSNSWPDVFRRLKSWDVLQAAACLLCKVELSGKIKMEDRISNKIVVGKKDKIWALYGKSWKWSDGVKKCCKPVVTRNLDMQCQLVQKIDRNNTDHC